jgi:hypothetical protein
MRGANSESMERARVPIGRDIPPPASTRIALTFNEAKTCERRRGRLWRVVATWQSNAECRMQSAEWQKLSAISSQPGGVESQESSVESRNGPLRGPAPNNGQLTTDDGL